MLTYTTVVWIIVALLVYGACVVGIFVAISRNNAEMGEDNNERIIRAEKMRVADRMREGRY